MRGHPEDDTDQPRPIFSRSADGRLRAGSNSVASPQQADDDPEPGTPKQPPVLVIPPKSQPVHQPAPHHIAPVAPVYAQQPESPPHTARQGYVQPLQHDADAHSHTDPSPQPISVSAAATAAVDVCDIWSEQERIRLRENWEEEQRKQARKQRRRDMLRKKVTGIDPSAEHAVKPAHTEPKEITLNISMPSVPKMALPKIRVPALPRISRQRVLLFGGVAAVLIVSGVGYGMYHAHQGNNGAVAKEGDGTETTANGVRIQHLDPSKQTGKPDYDTVLPAGKKIEDFGGWVRVSPPDKNPVYAYADKIDNVLINVSEQPVPDSFKKDIDTAMDDLAAQYSANDKIKVGAVTAYIGTSLKGPQSVLLVKGDILILMKSASKIADTHWETYIRSLQ